MINLIQSRFDLLDDNEKSLVLELITEDTASAMYKMLPEMPYFAYLHQQVINNTFVKPTLIQYNEWHERYVAIQDELKRL
jgi:hypothetical protein